MGMIKNYFKKPVSILKQEDVDELRELERKAYMEEAKKLVNKRAQWKAEKDYGVKKEKWE